MTRDDAGLMPNPASGRSASRTPRGRKWLFRLLAFGLSLMLLEGLVGLGWWLELPGTNLGLCSIQRQRLIVSGDLASHPTEAIHPYLGWVLNPDLHGAQGAGGREFPVNRFGLVDDGQTLYRRSSNKLLVGIVGGSVAQQVSLMSDGILKRRLEAAPRFQGREVRFVRLALSGHKQPQQLMALSYLLALGGELDLLINVDGYNEVALTMTENARHGVALSYPRLWHHRLQDVVDPRVDSHSFQLLRLKISRRNSARLVEGSLLRHSPTANLAWLAYDQWINASLVSLGEDLRAHREKLGHGFAKDGPKNDFKSEEELSGLACELWQQSSRQLHRMCTANGIRYVHVLQPNQYLEGSKPLSDKERKEYYVPDEPFAKAVRMAYPLMRSAGESLKTEGIAFRDATQLFAGETETIYSDCFCHYNQKGNDLLAEAVAQTALGSP